MRRAVHIAVTIVAVLLLVKPFDCFAGAMSAKAAACCAKGKCLPTRAADDCCKSTVPSGRQLLKSRPELHRLLKKPVPGNLLLNDDAVEFRSKRFSHRWPYREIKTLELSSARELVITDYENRHWHEPGERRFRFTLAQPMPPTVAA